MTPTDDPPAAARGTRATTPLVRTAERNSRVTTFELFFDLVYVFAFTQVSQLMAREHSAIGILQGIIVLALMWWTWAGFGWLANLAPADQTLLRNGMSLAMIVVFIAALAIPEAFEDLPGGLSGPLVFALAYVAVRVIHSVLYTIAAGDDRGLRRQILVSLNVAMVPAAVLMVVGALVGGQAQLWMWLIAMVYDGAATRLGSRGGGEWRIRSASHWTERHGLIVILALGESIVAIGVGVAREPITPAIVIGSAVAVAVSVLLWWSYFAKLADAGEQALEDRSGGAQVILATDGYSYGHFGIVAGIVLAALGIEDAMAHIADPEPFGWFGAIALGSGIALFAAATVWFGILVGIRWPYMRGVEAVVAVAAIPVLATVTPLAALVVAAALMAVVALIESRLHRRLDASADAVSTRVVAAGD